MKLITRDTDYALRALCFIAKHKKEIISVDRLAEESKIPRPFLRKILQKLNRAGILKSYKGQGGGFILLIPIHKIFLLNLIKIFQGRLQLNECFFKKKICPNIKICKLRKKIDNIEKYVISQLKNFSLADLLK